MVILELTRDSKTLSKTELISIAVLNLEFKRTWLNLLLTADMSDIVVESFMILIFLLMYSLTQIFL